MYSLFEPFNYDYFEFCLGYDGILLSSSQKELLCKQIGLASTVSSNAFEEAVYERIDKDDFRMQSLRW